MAGTLYIIATPIGNLSDLTARAAETLRAVDLVACEDTRQTAKLLRHLHLDCPMLSLHEHNEAQRAIELAARLEQGDDIALVSDAGTPLLSDPGFRVVREAAARQIRVCPIPGPSAALAALSASGLPTDEFHFGGFLPRKPGERTRRLEQLRPVPGTLVFYESPHRILDSLESVRDTLADPPVVVARELTKIHEEFLRGAASEVLETLRLRGQQRGEFTLLVGPRSSSPSLSGPEEEVDQLVRGGMERMQAIKRVAQSRGLPKSSLYRMLQRRD